jgi:predicted nucleotidyltransferase
MLDTLITSKTRIKIILKFFLNSNSSSYLRSLAGEFNESTNSIRKELNKFEDAGLLISYNNGNKKMYQANTQHPLFSDIHNIILKQIGFDHIIKKIIKKLGGIIYVYVIGDFAKGIDNKIIDLLLVGEKINKSYLQRLIDKGEHLIKRKIRYLILSNTEFKDYSKNYKGIKPLLLWKGHEI